MEGMGVGEGVTEKYKYTVKVRLLFNDNDNYTIDDNEYEFLGTEGDQHQHFRANHMEYDDIVVNGFLAHTLDEEVYGTGSGMDPVFVFL